jgi:hypothetical protein
MKLILLSVIALFFSSHCLQGDVPESIRQRYRQIINLVDHDDAKELSKLIAYPLRRPNPLPDIATSEQFVAYYSTIFDTKFKQLLRQYADSYIFERQGFGLVGGPFSGELWTDYTGKIMTVNYESAQEAKLQVELTESIKSHAHPSVRDWIENVLVCKSNSLLIRIDRTAKGLRYVSWSKGHTIAERPDLILYNGTEESQGAAGGWTWTFTNGGWTYIIDKVDLCEKEHECGLFLRLLLQGKEYSSTRMQVSKQ